MSTIQTYNWPTVPFGTYKPTQVSWASIETSRGAYNWSRLDSIVSLAQSKGTDLMYVFVSTPKWASANPGQACFEGATGCAAPPVNMADWETFVSVLATRYKGKIKYYEVWNEPNDLNFWTGTTAQMVDMTRRAYNQIKGIDSTASVLSPAPTWSKTAAWEWFNSFLAAGGGPYVDVVSFHGYTGTTRAESIFTIVDNVKKSMTTYGIGTKPMWITEGGWGRDPVVATAQQPGFLVQRMLLTLSRGVQRMYWYQWDNPSWGTLYNPSSKVVAPAGVAYGQLYSWSVGSAMDACAQGTDSTWTCNFTRANGTKARAVWNAVAAKTYATTGFTSYRTIDGKSVKITGTSVSIGYNPILLENTSTATTPVATPPTSTSTTCSYTGMAQPSVKVCQPTPASTSSTNVHLIALASDKSAIKTMQVYLDGKLIYTKNSVAKIDETFVLYSGLRALKVQATDSAGKVFSATTTVNVQ
ncbi:MAG TPA: glycosyl hydrolase [Terriglobales bacterium]|jgi:hypothetical protein|nr:glycosyl hydrolase [Terriglobales bacterium]